MATQEMQPGRLTRRERQEQTRLRILDAALGVFRREGFARATIEEVADLAGCTRGTVYLHFGTKEGLLVAVLEYHLDAQVAAFRGQVAAARTDRALVKLLVASTLPERERRTPVVLDWAAMVGGLQEADAELVGRAQVLQEQVDVEYARLVERLCELRGITPALPPRRVAVLLLALCHGLVGRVALDPSVDVEAEVRCALDLLLGGKR